MEVIVKGKLMDIISKEYNYNGKSGISHKVIIYDEGQVYNVVIPKEKIEEFEELIGKNVQLECKIFIKGSYNLKINE